MATTFRLHTLTFLMKCGLFQAQQQLIQTQQPDQGEATYQVGRSLFLLHIDIKKADAS